MPKKLFGMSWQRQTKTAIEILDKAGVTYDFLGIDESSPTSNILYELSGPDANIPVLFVDGIEYGGVEGIRRYIAQK
jgi:glutaredoxin